MNLELTFNLVRLPDVERGASQMLYAHASTTCPTHSNSAPLASSATYVPYVHANTPLLGSG